MTFWTVMVILHGVSVNGVGSSYVIYPTYQACSAALEVVYGTLDDKDAALTCRETDVPSSSIRPKQRPENFGN